MSASHKGIKLEIKARILPNDFCFWMAPAGIWHGLVAAGKSAVSPGDSRREQELQGSEGKAIFQLLVLLRIHLHSLPN